MNDQGATATYQRVYQEKARNNWQREKELLPYPQMGESLMGFLVRCHKMGSEVLMCPWCSALYDGRTAEAYKRIPYSQCWNNQSWNRERYINNARGIPKREDSPHPGARKQATFKPPTNMPTGKWLKAGQNRTEAKGKSKWRSFEEGGRTAWAFRRKFHSNKKQSHVSENYKGKNPMSRSKWRRHQ